jgi:HEPN domain-containing protein
MTSVTLARAYFDKARKRLRALAVLLEDDAYSDVIREAQELIELVLKGMLRFVGIEPPKQHDVGPLLLEHRDRLPEPVAAAADRLAAISHRLRQEREFAFYGDETFIPTEQYTREDATAALADAQFAVGLLSAFPDTDAGSD